MSPACSRPKGSGGSSPQNHSKQKLMKSEVEEKPTGQKESSDTQSVSSGSSIKELLEEAGRMLKPRGPFVHEMRVHSLSRTWNLKTTSIGLFHGHKVISTAIWLLGPFPRPLGFHGGISTFPWSLDVGMHRMFSPKLYFQADLFGQLLDFIISGCCCLQVVANGCQVLASSCSFLTSGCKCLQVAAFCKWLQSACKWLQSACKWLQSACTWVHVNK